MASRRHLLASIPPILEVGAWDRCRAVSVRGCHRDLGRPRRIEQPIVVGHDPARSGPSVIADATWSESSDRSPGGFVRPATSNTSASIRRRSMPASNRSARAGARPPARAAARRSSVRWRSDPIRCRRRSQRRKAADSGSVRTNLATADVSSNHIATTARPDAELRAHRRPRCPRRSAGQRRSRQGRRPSDAHRQERSAPQPAAPRTPSARGEAQAGRRGARDRSR